MTATRIPSGEYTSDQRGYVYIEGIPNVRYLLREITAPDGCILDNERKTIYGHYGFSTEIRWIMERFYQIPNCATAFQHTIYRFYTAPVIAPDSPYEDIHFSVVHPVPDYEITYQDFGVELEIKLNLTTASAESVIEKVKEVCKIHSMNLLT